MFTPPSHQFKGSINQYTPNNPPWRKLLWVKQNYPDNYFDSTFLDELQKNVNMRTYDYWTMVQASGVVTQHISSVVIFVAIFIDLKAHALSASHLIWTGTLLTATGYVLWGFIMLRTRNYELKHKRVARSAIFFFFTLLGLSPILKTLTSQISHDTIWALTVCCFLANVTFHDYVSTSRTKVKSLSTNAAIFASVLLASRLDTNIDVFSLLSFAVEWFALFPIFRRCLQGTDSIAQCALTIIMFLMCTLFFVRISKAVLFLYILGFCFLTFVCPYWLIFIQKYKNEIHGPWDEARPRLQRPKRGLYRKRTSQISH
ncbi:phosphatidylinositol N-acetylglucosaminyltransferase subunit C [Spinellus fusiger]|nr:phosphatidylinositol N-acetylglucosaminyltransferase subunit C [Spinellus fusiger]